MTLDREATSFLGLHFAHNTDRTVTITQPKLLAKLFLLHPPLKETFQTPLHPYSPLPPRTPIQHLNPQTTMHTSACSASYYISPRADQILWQQYPSQAQKAATPRTAISGTCTTSWNISAQHKIWATYYTSLPPTHYVSTARWTRRTCYIPTAKDTPATPSPSKAQLVRSITAASNRPPSPPPPHTPKLAQSSHSPRS
jgi:hypothetical protein